MARPRKQDARDLRLLAIDAAISLLTERQSPDLSMAEVARMIGCSAPALYAHFADKDDLLDTVRQAVLERQTAEKKRRYESPTKSALENLADGGHAYLDNAARAPAIYRLIYCRTPKPEKATEAASRPALTALARGVAACQAEGYATKHAPEEMARLLWSMVHGAALLALDSAEGQKADAWRDAHRCVDLAMALIRSEDTGSLGRSISEINKTEGPER
ncbi:TetR/AcrR family transcriptional regulator [Roseibacterium beibuensis]|uniref:TetR/AcrR family transcriptional regulator n=1 Tax=[Roseibacterium] beibuensis TaxID=1193142 RepID=A0ABP9LQA6_9RHOB|nr:TetR/AcrR family transcriptional regulator [Roseibacterium beibuensis]MCS6626866.1 TetR/AcrR family transcriptional regulator [Roseibacterium beibuensis]